MFIPMSFSVMVPDSLQPLPHGDALGVKAGLPGCSSCSESLCLCDSHPPTSVNSFPDVPSLPLPGTATT